LLAWRSGLPESKHLSLKAEAFSAVRWTTVAMVGRSALQFGQMMILARLLAPSDFGIMAVVVSVTAFMLVFTDLGVSTAIIHYQEITHEELSSLYWLNIIVGAVLMIALIVSSPLISRLYHEPALTPFLALISVNFLFLAVGQQLRVVAEKALRFSMLARVEILAAIGGCGTAVIWAWYRPSVYALVSGVLVNGFLQAVLLWILGSDGWRPAARLDLKGVRRFLKFGAYIVGGDFVNSLNRQADILVGGRFFPASVLGTYSLPRNLCLTFSLVTNPIITRVGLPVMAKTQEDKAFLKSVYLKTMRMTASVNVPVYLAIAVFSHDVVSVVFGTKWISSSPLLVFLAIWGLFRSCANPVGSLLFAIGRADRSFWSSIVQLCIVFPGLWGVAHFGIKGLAIGQVAIMAGALVPGWYFLVRPSCGARLGEYLMTLLGPLSAGAFAVLIAYVAVSHWTAPLWRLVAMALVALPAYLAASAAVNRSWLTSMRQLILRRT
jgi:lipopolysaccharide exporter